MDSGAREQSLQVHLQPGERLLEDHEDRLGEV
jgi:hypothetical protein